MKINNQNNSIMILCSLLCMVIIIFVSFTYYNYKNEPTIPTNKKELKKLHHEKKQTNQPSSKASSPNNKPDVKTLENFISPIQQDSQVTPTIKNSSKTKKKIPAQRKELRRKKHFPSFYQNDITPPCKIAAPISQDAFMNAPIQYQTINEKINGYINSQNHHYEIEKANYLEQKQSLNYEVGPKEYELTFENYPHVSFGIESDIFAEGAHNVSLLNKYQDFDNSYYMQALVNIPIHIDVPAEHSWRRVECNFTPRLNTIFGNNCELSRTTKDFIKIGKAVTETGHYHCIDRPLLFVRETWLKLYSLSEKSFFQIGLFPKQIGLGLILGNYYKVGNPILTSSYEKYIDQFRPGLLWSINFGERDYNFTFYYSMYDTNATSVDTQMEFTQSQELCPCNNEPPYTKADPSRPLLQNSHLISAELDIPIAFDCKSQKFQTHIAPFIMYKKDRAQTVEFFGDAESQLVTVGSTFRIDSDRIQGQFEIAGNFGSQDVKAWDRNITEEHARLNLTHIFHDNGSEWKLAEHFPPPTTGGKDSSLLLKSGQQYQVNGTGPIFLNSYTRFRKCYKNEYRAFMGAADFGIKLDCWKVGFIGGYSSGDDNPNDSQESVILHRLNSNEPAPMAADRTGPSEWDNVRKDYDKIHRGFIGVDSLYQGNNVRTAHMLRAQKLQQGLSQRPELTANMISNLIYGGLGLWYEKQYDGGTLRLNTNVIGFGQAHSIPFGFDPVVQDIFNIFNWKVDEALPNPADRIIFNRFKNHTEQLRKYIGMEWNFFAEFFAKKYLSFYGMVSVFLPGNHYCDIKHFSNQNAGKVIPLKNQLCALAKDVSGFENAEKSCITLCNHTAIAANAGINFSFDTSTINRNPFKRKDKKKKIR